MSFVSDLFAGGIKGILGSAKHLFDDFNFVGEDKSAFDLMLEALFTQRLGIIEASAMTEMKARSEVIIAELKHGDEYVSHTRPRIARWGLYVIMWNYAVVPSLGGLLKLVLESFDSTVAAAITVAPLELPTEFWVAWGGIVGTYAIGRSFEKSGFGNKLTRAATGSTSASALADKLLG